jgi:hypothetical protein
MDGMLPLLRFLLLGVVVAALAYYQHQRKIERQQQFAALALGHGLDFSIDDPFDTLGEPFALLRRGDGRGVENVLWGEWKGLQIRAFDYWCYEESTDSKGHTSRSYSRFDCVFTRIDASCPALQISEENVFTRAGGRAHVPRHRVRIRGVQSPVHSEGRRAVRDRDLRRSDVGLAPAPRRWVRVRGRG